MAAACRSVCDEHDFHVCLSGLGGAFHYAPKVTFQVPEIGRIYYAGTLRADLSRSRRDQFRGEPGTMSFSVHDDYVSELQNFCAVTGIDPNQVEKRLMAQHAG